MSIGPAPGIEMSAGFTTAPRSRVFPDRASVVDKQLISGDRHNSETDSRDQRRVHCRPRGCVFANRVGTLVRDKQIPSGHRDTIRTA
jgi:hypothetical protein